MGPSVLVRSNGEVLGDGLMKLAAVAARALLPEGPVCVGIAPGAGGRPEMERIRLDGVSATVRRRLAASG